MGYLINPIGFRVGQTQQWEDVWFSFKSLYPEYLHFCLKIRLFLNGYLNSMPSLTDVASEYNKSDFPSLFNAAILYSHFRLTFTLNFVHIALYVYPGKYWDSFLDKWTFRRFSSIFSKSMYWVNSFRKRFRSKSLFAGTSSNVHAYKLAGRLLDFSKMDNIFAKENFSQKTVERKNFFLEQRSFFSSPQKWDYYVYKNKHNVLDKRWTFLNEKMRAFFWEYKDGFQLLLLFFLFFKPFNTIIRMKSLFFKSYKRYNSSYYKFMDNIFSFAFYKKQNKLFFYSKLCYLLSSNFFFYFNWGFFFINKIGFLKIPLRNLFLFSNRKQKYKGISYKNIYLAEENPNYYLLLKNQVSFNIFLKTSSFPKFFFKRNFFFSGFSFLGLLLKFKGKKKC